MSTLLNRNAMLLTLKTKIRRYLPLLSLVFIFFTVPLVGHSDENIPRPNKNKSLWINILKEKNLNLQSGTESGGGGSTDRQRIYKPLADSLEKLSVKTEYVFKPNKSANFNAITVKIDDLIWALRNATMVITHDQLYDKDNAPVDAYNIPFKEPIDQGKIKINIDKWNAKSDFDKVQIGLHELMGTMKIPDPYYWVSTRLAEYVFANSSQTHNSVNVCGITLISLSENVGQASIESIKRGFEAEGGQVHICYLKDFIYKGRGSTAVIGVYLNGAYALLVPDPE
ncbi:MAG: hypothetical protein ACXVCP_18915 [Bdellovibrio sp.]